MSPSPSQSSARTTRPDYTAQFAPVRPGTSVGQVFAFVAGFVALAAIGAAVGWGLTKGPGTSIVAGPSSSPSLSSTPTAPASPTTPPAGEFVIPDFAHVGTLFQDARSQLITQKLGVVLYFGFTTGGDGTVSRTFPLAGSAVSKGQTIKVFVNGAAPILTVPNVTGQPCATAGKMAAAAGLAPKYANGKNGLVAAQSPTADSTTTHWNDTVMLICTPDGNLPPTSPPPSSPSTSASPDASPSPDSSG